uniref:Beta-crystallin A2 n=1 Tax=Cyprinus carpio TaxID=7962 RepID=A0A8C2B481_CYPCA
MNPQEQLEQRGKFRMTVFEEEYFQGKSCEFTFECQNILDRDFRKIRSIKVENGPWVGYEYPEFQGQQFILEKGDYPCYQAWSGNSSYRTEHMLSFRPIKCAVSLCQICEDLLQYLFHHLCNFGTLGLLYNKYPQNHHLHDLISHTHPLPDRTTVTVRLPSMSVKTSWDVNLRCVRIIPPFKPWVGAARKFPQSK